MDIWIRSMQDWSHKARYRVLSHDVPLYSFDKDPGTATIPGEHDGLSDNWAVLGGRLYLITGCSPKNGSTALKLLLPEHAFSRQLRAAEYISASHYGDFMAARLTAEYVEQSDALYAMPYLTVSNSDTTSTQVLMAPETVYTLRDVMLEAALAGVYCTWTPSLSGVDLQIAHRAPAEVRLIDGDGHTQVVSQAYTRSIAAKATVRRITKALGSMLILESAVYYWHLDGTVSTTPPSPRVPGEWVLYDADADRGETLYFGASEAFKENSDAYKLEFYSDRTLQLGDQVICRFRDLVVKGRISCASVSSKDCRTLYRAGRSDTTLTDKLRRVSDTILQVGVAAPAPIAKSGAVDVPQVVFGDAAPTASTPGRVRQLYYDRTGKRLYVCTAAGEGSYTWEKCASESQIRIYNSVTSLGLTSGSATIAGAYSALAANELLICPAAEFASGQRPYNTGIVEIIKRYNDGSAGSIRFLGLSAVQGDYRMFISGSSPFVPTGEWVSIEGRVSGLPNNTDLNDVTTPGTYLIDGNNTYTNAPSGYGTLECISHRNDRVYMQRITNLVRTYWRYARNSATTPYQWGDWYYIDGTKVQ